MVTDELLHELLKQTISEEVARAHQQTLVLVDLLGIMSMILQTLLHVSLNVVTASESELRSATMEI